MDIHFRNPGKITGIRFLRLLETGLVDYSDQIFC